MVSGQMAPLFLGQFFQKLGKAVGGAGCAGAEHRSYVANQEQTRKL